LPSSVLSTDISIVPNQKRLAEITTQNKNKMLHPTDPPKNARENASLKNHSSSRGEQTTGKIHGSPVLLCHVFLGFDLSPKKSPSNLTNLVSSSHTHCKSTTYAP
jgi:hypothetical protein